MESNESRLLWAPDYSLFHRVELVDVELLDEGERLLSTDSLALEAVVETLFEVFKAADQRLLLLIQVEAFALCSRRNKSR